MRFVADWGAAAELLTGRGAEAEMLAGAPWRSDCREAEPWQSCWLERCGGAGWPGRCGRDAAAREIHREEGKKACEKEKQHLRRTCTYPSR